MFAYPREERPTSSDFESVATPVEAWSPATTDRSTPPYDSRLVSPTRQRANPTPLYDSRLASPIRQRTNLTSLYDSCVVDSCLVTPTRQRPNRRVGGGEVPASALDRPGTKAAVGTNLGGTQGGPLGGVASHGAVDVSRTRDGASDAAGAATASPQSAAAIGKVLRFFRKRTRSAKIGSAESPTSARTPASHTPRKAGEAFSIDEMPPASTFPEDMAMSPEEMAMSPEEMEMSPEEMVMSPEAMSMSMSVEARRMSPGTAVLPVFSALAPPAQIQPLRPSSRGSLEYSPSPSPRAPFGGKLHSPSRLFMDGRDSNAEDRYEDDAELGAPAPTATVRLEPEGDLEEGGVSATMAKADAAVAGVGAGTRAAAAAAAGASARVGDSIVVVNNGIVMPCAPSDEEKVRF